MKQMPLEDFPKVATKTRTIRPKAAAASGPSGDTVENRSVSRACDILKCLENARDALGLAEVAALTGLSKPTAYRILSTLVTEGMIERLAKNTYASAFRSAKQKRFRIGFASQSEEFAFSRLVSESIQTSAYDARIDLLILNNRYSAAAAVRNAELFVREHVDLVIEFQTSQERATTVSSRLMNASIPIIAIEIPHPGATYFGANNQRAGAIAGKALVHACRERWKGQFDELVLLELPAAGPLVHSRLTAMVSEVRKAFPEIAAERIRYLNGNGRLDDSMEAMRRYLRRGTRQNLLLGAINDPSCLGALRAVEEAGRGSGCLAVSHNGSLEARMELRRPGSSLIGSVAYFPEQYGEAVIRLALDKLQGRTVPAASFVKHELLTRETVDALYPHDSVLSEHQSDSLLFSRH
jgi:ribose transport system substrate-binding protein